MTEMAQNKEVQEDKVASSVAQGSRESLAHEAFSESMKNAGKGSSATDSIAEGHSGGGGKGGCIERKDGLPNIILHDSIAGAAAGGAAALGKEAFKNADKYNNKEQEGKYADKAYPVEKNLGKEAENKHFGNSGKDGELQKTFPKDMGGNSLEKACPNGKSFLKDLDGNFIEKARPAYPADGGGISKAYPADGSGFSKGYPADGANSSKAYPADGANFNKAYPADGSGFSKGYPADGANSSKAYPADGASQIGKAYPNGDFARSYPNENHIGKAYPNGDSDRSGRDFNVGKPILKGVPVERAIPLDKDE